ncbi:MAG TPA: tetratricopeptide repeat protein [Polyangia bacterium]|nr:tetratricopeptide repeat protein [Polyangia bacterium]
MSDAEKPKGPVPPFPVDESEWESELAAWDAQLPITTEGATPSEENPFVETPTTIVASESQLAAAVAEDFAQGPASGIYESIVASVDAEESQFASEPPSEGPVSLVVDPLPEMAADPWRGDLRALVTVPDTIPPPEPPQAAYWKGFGRQLVDQLSVADTAAQQADLTLAAARAAERAGDPDDALRLYDDALILQPNNPAARRGRFRLLEARGDRDGAFAALGRLVDAATGDERAFYRGVQAEWALARGEKASAAMPAGVARSMAEAELAIRRNSPADAAPALEHAAYAVGGHLGAALMTMAARFNSVAGDAASAAEQRFVAARLGGLTLGAAVGRLPDAARLAVDDEEGAGAALEEILGALPPSALAVSVARWAARLARRRGDKARARQILADAAQAGGSPTLRRDRLEQATPGAGPGSVPVDVVDRAEVDQLFAAVAADQPEASGRSLLALRHARTLVALGAPGDALAILEEALSAASDAVPLALAAQALGEATIDRTRRARALRLWAGHDAARAASAAWALAETAAPEPRSDGIDVGDGDDDGDGDGAATAAWRAAMVTAPRSLAFWKLSAAAWAEGDGATAAEALSSAIEAWPVSGLRPAWRERIDELRPSDATSSPAQPSAATALPADDAGGDADTRATLLLRRALAGSGTAWLPASASLQERNARCEALEQVLAVIPDHPIALGLLMLQGAHRADAMASALWACGSGVPSGATEADREASRQTQLQAVEWLIQGSNRLRAVELARALLARHPGWAPARDLLRQLAATGPGPTERAQALLAVVDPGASDAQALLVAEAREQVGEPDAAAALYDRLRGGPFSADARRGQARLGRAADGAIDARLDGWLQAAQAGRWGELVDRLETEPPHEAIATAPTLYLAALLDEGRRDGKRAGRLIREAMASGIGRRGSPPPGLMIAARALDAVLAQDDHTPGEVVGAAQALAQRIARGEGPGMPRSAAAALVGVAQSLQLRRHPAEAETLLRAALAHDPHSLPALAGLRGLLGDGSSWRDVVDLCEREAAVLRVPAHRAATVLFAARVVLARGADDPSRAISLLRQVLTIAPDNQHAFERLRIVWEEAGDYGRVVELLAARIAVATNPFEISALRLARADLLYGKLGDRAAARAELAAILHKEPQHGRALSRLADLQYEEGAFAEAAELYINRARTERAPERLREIFLRLGRIYTQKLPDTKRGIGAYARVLQLDNTNREALACLSELYTSAGEIKNAVVVTDRLIEQGQDLDPPTRVAYLVRLGQLWERAGDVRQAGAHFRRAVDEAPRDLAAISELARHLERTHDFSGRRALLDHALSVMRFEIQAGHLTIETLRATAAILEWRGKTAAAASAAQLLAAVAGDQGAVQAVADWAAPPPDGRSLQALASSEADDLAFPPGLLPGVRNIFRLLGPVLVKGPPDLKQHNLSRGERVGRGHPVRQLVDPIAAQLGVTEFDLYVKRPSPSSLGSPPLMAEPGTPPTVVVGAEIVNLGPGAVRFAAGRSLRLAATHLDLVLRYPPEQSGAMVAGVVRQFVGDYHHPQVADADAAAAEARVSRLLPRKLRQEIMHFALESARGFDLAALVAAVRDGANVIGLLAGADLPAALAAILASRGGGRPSLSLEAIAADEETLALLSFALSDLHTDLARAME